MSVLFITGIDTGSGKTRATGLMARYLRHKGVSVITQKMVQTGLEEGPLDIEVHRKIMGIDYIDEKRHLTCPYRFQYPASPHLAAELENEEIDPGKIATATEVLEEEYDMVLLEGVGGIYVPLTRDFTQLNYLANAGYPVVVVTSAKLGSINHTLMTMEVIRDRGLAIKGLVYNQYPGERKEIVEDSRRVFKDCMARLAPGKPIIDMPFFTMDEIPDVDFQGIL